MPNTTIPNINVLILVEDENEAYLIIESLNSSNMYNYLAYHASTIMKGREIIKEKNIDVVLFDLAISDSYGSHTFIKLFEDFSTLPFIILTEINDDAIALNSVLEGAQDFLLKDQINQVVLVKSIHYAIQRKKTEQKVVATIIEAEEEVRKRIACELHDSLGQNLSSAFMNMQSLKQETTDWRTDKQKVYNQAIQSLQDSISEIQGIARNLMPKTIEEFGLVASIESIVNSFHSVEVEFYFFDNFNGKSLDLKTELSLYRIVQESVNNCLKYAKASSITIHLMMYKENIILMIEDDGVGFDSTSTKSKGGIGLISIKNRVKSLSGNLIIDSSLGKGTTITVEIPKQN
tara:strand:- start:752 stop:1792 length:1041 start_codon:yes stop_codon:yes gene_type:complete